MDCELAPIVSLNVGGKKFTTSRDTLCKVRLCPSRTQVAKRFKKRKSPLILSHHRSGGGACGGYDHHWVDALCLAQHTSSLSTTCSHITSQSDIGTLYRMAVLCWQGCSVVLCSAGATRRWVSTASELPGALQCQTLSAC